MHGVYKPGNVKLHPELLEKHQAYVKDKIGAKSDKPVFFVFHGGSGSTKKEYQDAISYGVVKVNVDTDMQYAYMSGIRDYMLGKKDYLAAPVGNPDGEDKPNKKFFDPRVSSNFAQGRFEDAKLCPTWHSDCPVLRIVADHHLAGLGSRRREDHVGESQGGIGGLQSRWPAVRGCLIVDPQGIIVALLLAYFRLLYASYQ